MERPDGGLCDDCAHAVEVRSARGSCFLRCACSERDRRYPKYPPLPVLRCPGYAPGGRPVTSSGDPPG
ncbi:MAG: hypothetical protein PVI30_07965 [Myxococcales bacterium]